MRDQNPLEAYGAIMDGILDEKWGYKLNVANSVFYHKGTNSSEDFQQDISNYFAGQFQPLDFEGDHVQATDAINEWASEQTNGMISPLYPSPLDPTTAMVLASSVYFKASWQKKFTLESDNDEFCWIVDREASDADDGCLNDVEFMTVTDMMYHTELGMAEVLEVPFQFNRFPRSENNFLMMQLWIPSRGSELFITDAEHDLQFQKYIKENIFNARFNAEPHRRMQKRRIKLTMPKFNVDFNEDLVQVLKDQGMNKVFTREADFSRIVGEALGSEIFISGIDHAVQFNLDEEGVEGAAVAAVRGEFRSAHITKNVMIDRPFYFAITTRCFDNKRKNQWRCPYNNTPLFIGKVVTPSVKT